MALIRFAKRVIETLKAFIIITNFSDSLTPFMTEIDEDNHEGEIILSEDDAEMIMYLLIGK